MGNELSYEHIRYFWFPIAIVIKILVSATALGGAIELYFKSHKYFSFKKIVSIALGVFSVWQIIDLWFFFKM
jgi:hypothetical protein